MAAVYCLRPSPRPFQVLTLGWVLFAAAVMLGQSGGPGQAIRNSEPATYTLTGTVVNSVTGDPIPRALVQAGERMQLTDSQGKFEIGGFAAGIYGLSAQKPGFFFEADVSGGFSFPLTATAGQETSPIVVKLIPEGVILGHIKDEYGEPLEGVAVRVQGWRIVDGRRRPQQFGSQSTDEDGYFRLFGLMPGTYYVAASAAADRDGILLRQGPDAKEGYPPTYYPGVRQLSAATPIRLAAGQTVQADFALRRVPTFQVSGQLMGYPGIRLQRLQISDTSDPSATVGVQLNHGTGTFIARTVPAGSYRIEATATDPAGRMLVGEATVNVNANVSGVMIALAPSVSIPVVVQTEFINSSPAGSPDAVTVRLSAADFGQNFLRPDPWSRPEENKGQRRLVVASVPPGRYYVEALPAGNWYVQSLVSGSTDLLAEPLTVGSGSQVAPIQVVLRDDAATLAGEVRSDGAAVAGTVLAVMTDAPLRPPRVVLADAHGAFRFDNVPPGNYMVLAFDDIAGLEYANRDSLRDYLSRATQITLGSKDAKTVAVELIHR
jgi:hypothetical protein